MSLGRDETDRDFFFFSVGESSEPWEETAKLLLCFLIQLTYVDFLRPLQMFQQPASGDEYMTVRSDCG